MVPTQRPATSSESTRCDRCTNEHAGRAAGWRREAPARPRSDQTFWLIVPPGFSLPQRVVTKRPDVADRVTERLLEVPDPTLSLVVVVRGDRAAWALVTKRPLRALRLTERLLAITVSLSPAAGRVPDTLGISLNEPGVRRLPARMLPHLRHHKINARLRHWTPTSRVATAEYPQDVGVFGCSSTFGRDHDLRKRAAPRWVVDRLVMTCRNTPV